VKRRDRIVVALANALLRLASARYRALVKGLIAKGLEQAAREAADREQQEGGGG
jgi:hypothetical protein